MLLLLLLLPLLPEFGLGFGVEFRLPELELFCVLFREDWLPLPLPDVWFEPCPEFSLRDPEFDA